MKRAAILAAMMAGLLALSACSTIAGIGEDLSAGARTVQSWF